MATSTSWAGLGQLPSYLNARQKHGGCHRHWFSLAHATN